MEEPRGSWWRALLRWTKFRAMASLTLDLRDHREGKVFQIRRPGGFSSSVYELIGPDRTLLAIFRSKVVRLFGLPLIHSPFTLEICQPWGTVIGTAVTRNITILGPIKTTLRDRYENEVGVFEWHTSFANIKDCRVTVLRVEDPWPLLTLVTALIRGVRINTR